MATKTTSLSLARLHNGQLIQFLKGLVTLILRLVPAPSVKLAALIDQLRTKVAQMELVHKQSTDSQLSDAIARFDALRDGILSGLYWLLDAYAANELKPRERAAALLLQNLFKKYGPTPSDVRRLEYNDQTSAINGILKDLRTAPGAADAALLLPAAHFSDDLAAINNDFNDNYLQRTILRSQATSEYTFEDLRNAVPEVYENLLHKLEVELDVAEGAAPWPEVIAAVNAHTEKFRNIIRARGTALEAEAEAQAGA
ncbi:DUF6261 family protein [Flaviaesturariibacter aridisoli]|uniref:Uncharacterized protein n=1 Tax=Flaviaesturariibacter aridisoli TaxID=2545761 RepID=A0A4R4E354_9BACT|nr:DUF6261 family protein [Flaviaesturariibacter aridisoli]TCZ73070.1 hypothetical protein E0486_06875 [Flaviaesturariibacter aridisoli]